MYKYLVYIYCYLDFVCAFWQMFHELDVDFCSLTLRFYDIQWIDENAYGSPFKSWGWT